MGDEFYERLNSRLTGLHPNQWLRALAEETGAALRASVAGGAGDWRQLWALLCGLALMVPPGDTQSETAKLARARFPDIKDPYVAVLAEAGKAAKLLADRGLASGLGHAADGCRVAGDPLLACDTYGSRFLLVAPFSYDGEVPRHWYAWDIDACWILTVVGAGVFGSAQDALAEWQHVVGPAAGTALSPGAPETTARLLAPCLETGPLSGMLEGSEPRELIWEYYRLRRPPAASSAPSRHGRQRCRGLVRRRRPRPGARGVPGLVRCTARRCPAGRGRRCGHDSSRVGTGGTARRELALRVLTAPDRDGGAPDP